MTRECHVRFCERLQGQFQRPTHHFGMKAHIGVDARSGLVHTAGVTSGSVHDATVMDRLIRDDDTTVYGDKGYASGPRKRAAEAAGVYNSGTLCDIFLPAAERACTIGRYRSGTS